MYHYNKSTVMPALPDSAVIEHHYINTVMSALLFTLPGYLYQVVLSQKHCLISAVMSALPYSAVRSGLSYQHCILSITMTTLPSSTYSNNGRRLIKQFMLLIRVLHLANI